MPVSSRCTLTSRDDGLDNFKLELAFNDQNSAFGNITDHNSKMGLSLDMSNGNVTAPYIFDEKSHIDILLVGMGSTISIIVLISVTLFVLCKMQFQSKNQQQILKRTVNDAMHEISIYKPDQEGETTGLTSIEERK